MKPDITLIYAAIGVILSITSIFIQAYNLKSNRLRIALQILAICILIAFITYIILKYDQAHA